MSSGTGVVDHVCRPECVPVDDVPPRVGTARYVLRRAAFACTHVVAVVFGFATVVLSQRLSRRLLSSWARVVLRATGITVEVRGAPMRPGANLMTYNHVSFFDAFAVWTLFPGAVAVSTHQSRNHPVIGRLTRNSGTVYVDGTTPKALPGMVRDVTAGLNAGNAVFVAPEGCIRCHVPGGPFPPAVLQAAINADAAVQPMLIRCVLPDGGSTAQAAWFTSTEDLATMLRRVLRIRGLRIRVTCFPAINASVAADRRELAALAKQPIDDAAGPMPGTCVGVAGTGERRSSVVDQLVGHHGAHGADQSGDVPLRGE